MRKFILNFAALLAVTSLLPSCLDDDTEDYSEWKSENVSYVDKMLALTENGSPVYTKISPTWNPGAYVLMKWHNDPNATAMNLRPLFNSTCDVVYKCSTIDGVARDSSYLNTTNGDSIYRCLPSAQIQGFAIALTNMHVGDSCTVVMPYNTAYGTSGYGAIDPYSTLIFELKLKDVPEYQIPS
jgi:FKBP-type peptidyl-prolyl cis-trans isomerase FklB